MNTNIDFHDYEYILGPKKNCVWKNLTFPFETKVASEIQYGHQVVKTIFGLGLKKVNEKYGLNRA